MKELLSNCSIKPDDNLDKVYVALKEARANVKSATSIADLKKAHKYTYDNGYLLFAKQECVCIYCGERFSSDEIKEHSYSKTRQALCPICGIDAIVGEVAGYKLTDKFIEAMYEYFFNNAGEYSKHFLTRIE
jgi:predicted Zn-ribbon and HTH transcriptional regulator